MPANTPTSVRDCVGSTITAAPSQRETSVPPAQSSSCLPPNAGGAHGVVVVVFAAV